MTARRRCRLAAAFALTIIGCSPAAAQTTRAEVIAAQQEEKAQQATPYRPNRAEVFFDQLEQGKWVFGVPRGWYFASASVYPGGGFAAGGGYRQYIGYDSFVDLSALYSVKEYKKVQLTGYTPNHIGGRVDLSGSIAWLDAPKVSFYGLGNDSSPDRHTTFRLNRSYIEGAVVGRVVKWLGLRLNGGVDDYLEKPGLGRLPSIEEIFPASEVPQLRENPMYLRGEVSATAYWLESPGYSRTGGLYRVAYEEFNPLRGRGGTFGFLRTQIVQHVPILRETWVVSLRGGLESIARKSDVVPYFLMPTLGGGRSLRGYPDNRFRDRHTLLMTGELRWFPNRAGLDMAFFVDAGKVAPNRKGLTLDGLWTDYGIGVRLHSLVATPLRIDVARGREGTRLVVAAGPVF